MGKQVGRVKESEGDKVKLIITNNEPLCYGQLLRIHAGISACKTYYSRIINAGSKSTLEEVHELQDLTGSMRTVGPYSRYRYIESVIFLEKNEQNQVRAPTLNPDYGWIAESLDETDYNTLKISGKLPIGYLRSGLTATQKEAGIDIENIPRMMAIVGQIGSGKTNAELVLNSSILSTSGDAVALIFDFAGELLTGKEIGKGLIDHPNAHELLKYYGTEKPEKNINFDLVHIGLRKLKPKDLWFLLPELTYPQEHYAEKLYQRIGSDDWIAQAVTRYKNEDISGLMNITAGQRAVAEALLRKLCSLNGKVFYDVNYDFTPNIINSLNTGRSVLVDISGLREETQKQIVNWVTSHVVKYYKDLWRINFDKWKRLPYLLITLEEAHKFLSDKGTLFADIALTYRKYKVGINAITPRPSGINRDIFAELWTKVILKTTLKEDRTYLSDNTPYLEYSDTELKMLDVGEALLVSQPKIHFAVPIKIFDYKEYLDKKKSKENFILKVDQELLKFPEVEEKVI